MKYPCNLIQDLLPLYHDGVCSEESVEIIEKHLSECTVCKEYLAILREADKMIVNPQNTEQEMKRVASFQAVKKKLFRKQVFIVAIAFVLLSMIALAVVGILQSSEQIISYENNISVSMTNNGLIGRLQGNQANYFRIKRIEITTDGQMNTYLFFYLSGTKWEAITTSDEVFSEYVLCPADKGAAQVNSVFYYTGDYTGIESMSETELQKIIDASVLLWSK